MAWGECALKCKESITRSFGKCTFWTWALSSCLICEKGICYLHYTGTKEPEPDIVRNHRGHISGSRKCQDIGFQNGNVKPLRSKIKSGLSDGVFPVGVCQSNCPAQEVPGYRYKGMVKAKSYNLALSLGGQWKGALLMIAQML